MAAAAGPLFWCHQCNVQTRPLPGGGDVLCSFCNGGFVEEMDATEVEPGVAFSSLPLPLNNILRMPSPASVGMARPRPRSADGDHQVHRPRLISRQSSNISSLLDAMMAVMDQFDARGSVSPPSGLLNASQSHGSDQASQDDSASFFMPAPPLLIVHGGMPNGFRQLQVLIDNGQGLGPELLPDHIGDNFLGLEFDRLIQLLSENDPNRYGSPPAAKSAVEALPKFTISEEHMASEILECAVCKDDFELGNEVQQMPCKHMFHPDCILPWLQQHNSCPVCRFELPTDDADYESRKIQTSGNRDSGNAQEQSSRGREQQVQDGSSGGEGHGRQENGEGLRHFTLWGMPGFGFDLTRLSISSGNMDRPSEEATTTGGEGNTSGTDSDSGTDRTSIPLHWLFRLFSSGGFPSRDSTGTGGIGEQNHSNSSSH